MQALSSRHLDIDLLRTLVTIADLGSFSAAAEVLGRTQSAISLQIKRLEENVGHSLLSRSQGRVNGVTAEGQVLIGYARRILKLNDEAYGCFLPSRVSGQLRLGLPEELMESVFPVLLTRFVAAFPQVELSVHCDLSLRLAARAEAGELDMAIVKQVVTHPLVPAGGQWKILKREPLVWFVGEGSNAADLSPLPIGVFHEGCVFRTAALAALAQGERQWKLAFVGSSSTALRQAVLAGIAIAPLPPSLLQAGIAVQQSGLPPLPDTELVARLAPGSSQASAKYLLELFEAQLWQA